MNLATRNFTWTVIADFHHNPFYLDILRMLVPLQPTLDAVNIPPTVLTHPYYITIADITYDTADLAGVTATNIDQIASVAHHAALPYALHVEALCAARGDE
jgi:hypothetical protein